MPPEGFRYIKVSGMPPNSTRSDLIAVFHDNNLGIVPSGVWVYPDIEGGVFLLPWISSGVENMISKLNSNNLKAELFPLDHLNLFQFAIEHHLDDESQ